jgi:multidrug efflux pump subunit AcrB
MQPVQDLTVEIASAARSTSTRSKIRRRRVEPGRRGSSTSCGAAAAARRRQRSADEGLQAYARDRSRHRFALGITPQAIDDALYDAFGQRQVSTIFTQLNQYHVVLEVLPEFQQNPARCNDIYVRLARAAARCRSARSRTVESAQRDRAACDQPSGAVSRRDDSPSISRPARRSARPSSAIEQAQKELACRRASRRLSGHGAGFQASLANEPLLILAAIVTVYIVLGVLYESYIHPITILSTLPSAGVGALLALMICRTELSVIALIGIILLIGIVKKNAIMMIDFALDAERTQGKSPRDAIYQACLLRFRPIMMTTMAALFGALPLALGTGVGSELRRPLGITIVGGLLVSQLLTLLHDAGHLSLLRSPLERQFGHIAGVTEMTSSSSLGSTRITLQFDLTGTSTARRATCRRRSTPRVANLPTNLPQQSDYRKVNPADAPIMIIALTSDIYEPRPALRCGLDDHAAEAVADRRRRAGQRRRQRVAGGAGGGQSHRVEQVRARPGGRAQRC